MLKLVRLAVAAAAVLLLGVPQSQAAEKPQEWNLVNPSGVIFQSAVEPAQRITSLDGKTIALRWNGKNNGDVVLDRLADLLVKKFPSAKIVKTYENADLNTISGTAERSQGIAKAMAAVKPDIVIASQAD